MTSQGECRFFFLSEEGEKQRVYEYIRNYMIIHDEIGANEIR